MLPFQSVNRGCTVVDFLPGLPVEWCTGLDLQFAIWNSRCMKSAGSKCRHCGEHYRKFGAKYYNETGYKKTIAYRNSVSGPNLVYTEIYNIFITQGQCDLRKS